MRLPQLLAGWPKRVSVALRACIARRLDPIDMYRLLTVCTIKVRSS